MLICDCSIWLKLQASGLCKHLAFAIIMDESELPPGDAPLDPHSHMSSSQIQRARTKHAVLHFSTGSSVGPSSSSAIRARINADRERAVERNNAAMVKELRSIQATNHPYVTVLAKSRSGELMPCRPADQVTVCARALPPPSQAELEAITSTNTEVTGTRNAQRDMSTPSVGSCSTWTVDHAMSESPAESSDNV